MKFVVCKSKSTFLRGCDTFKLKNCICVDTFSQAHTDLIKDVMVKLIMGENNTKKPQKKMTVSYYFRMPL